MTKRSYITNYTTTKYNNHAKFGGLIYLSDFDTEHPNGNIAARIAADWKFDEKCKKASKSRTIKTKGE